MSNLERDPQEAVGGQVAVAAAPVREVLTGREVVLGTRDMMVTRTLPHRERRMVGAWCFVDQYGPDRLNGHGGMRVPPHPHTGLQTVSWLVEGEVLHRDSLGNTQLIRPGQLNLMTAGRAISHSEESPPAEGPGARTGSVLHGVQLWVALPEPDRHTAPAFAHHPDLPVLTEAGATITVLLGEFGGARSPARAYTPIVGADSALAAGADVRLPTRPDFEYAALPLSGGVEVDGLAVSPGALLYLGCGRSDLPVRAAAAGNVLLLGGVPFDERIIMWWNFVGRTHEEIVQAREDWMAGRGFGAVRGYDGDPLPAPPMPATPLKPRGRLR
jgi:quercetin 2,3-dioxygenase